MSNVRKESEVFMDEIRDARANENPNQNPDQMLEHFQITPRTSFRIIPHSNKARSISPTNINHCPGDWFPTVGDESQVVSPSIRQTPKFGGARANNFLAITRAPIPLGNYSPKPGALKVAD